MHWGRAPPVDNNTGQGQHPRLWRQNYQNLVTPTKGHFGPCGQGSGRSKLPSQPL